ncbi:hypothetical protein CLU79DRAFT_885344 [Phycomyces nitens]|nr:hypothetical protein CLU79DRAFT_885344 [Phycomyces nitens]
MYYNNISNGSNVQKTFQDRLDGSNPNSLQSQSFIPQQQNQDHFLDTSSYLSDTNDFSLHPDFLTDNQFERFNDDKSYEWDFATHNQQYSIPQNTRQQDPSRLDYNTQPLLERQEQDILFSDPTFLRQQQFLQNQQRAMQIRIDQEENEHKKDHIDLPPCSRSNLSAMFDLPVSSTVNSEISSKGTNSFCAEKTYQEQSSQPKPTLQNTQVKKEPSYRLSHPSYTGPTRTNPIPIGTPPSSDPLQISTSSSSSVPVEIDHQRRFNELQARFRVNCARKPQKKKGTTPALVSASFTDSPNNFGQISQSYTPEFSFGTSMPTLGQDKAHQGLYGASDAQQSSHERRVSLDKSFLDQPRRGSVDQGIPIPSDGHGSQAVHATSFPSRTMPIQIQRIQRGGMSQPFDAEQHQRRLDDQLERANFEDITVSELKDMLRQRGKPATGKKAVLLQRLQEERDNIQAARSGRAQRFSQPPPASRRIGEFSRPKSFQGTSPMMSANTPQSPLFSSPSSVPNTSFLPGSPGSSYSLYRSIDNMHIGSPPQHTRRFSPYAAPSSPRLASPSPKLQPQISVSSLPDTASSPVSPSFNGFPNTVTPTISSRRRAYPSSSPMTLSIGNQGFNNRRRSYAPFTSSALATPDREDDNPFEDMTDSTNYTQTGLDGTEQINEGMEWLDPSLESLVQQAYVPNDSTAGMDFLQGATHEEIMAFLADQDINYDMSMGIPMEHIKAEESDISHLQNGFDFSSFSNMDQGSYQNGGW